MLSFHLKRHNRLLTLTKRYVAEIYQQARNYNPEKLPLQQHEQPLQQQQQQQHITSINVQKQKSLWDLNRMLQFNHTFNQRIVFNLELYHKNVLKKFNQRLFYKISTSISIHKNFIDTDVR